MESEEKKPTEKRKIKVLDIALIVIGACLIIFAAYNLIKIGVGYRKEEKVYEDLVDKYVTEKKKPVSHSISKDSEEKGPEWYELFDVDIEGIQAQNSDVVGWIIFENEDMNYPVMQGKDNDYYLHTGLDGSYLKAGSIFMDMNNSSDFNDNQTIIYGHNMHDKSMFTKLHNYRKDGYYDDHQYFQIITNDYIYRYHVFSYYDINEADGLYQVYNVSEDYFANYLSQFHRHSYYDTDVEATVDDKVITLSTCTNDGSDGLRFVVHGVREETYERKK